MSKNLLNVFAPVGMYENDQIKVVHFKIAFKLKADQ